MANRPRNVHRHLSTSSSKSKIFGPPDPDGPPAARKNFRESLLPPEWRKFIDRYPDFLPDPMQNNPLHISRQVDDMLKRRCVIEIPDFYVGSIMRVTCSDRYSETKRTKFTGICIQRTGQLLWSNFTLRNVIDGMGVEVRYDLYNPLILSIEVLRLQKRLDDELIYLRDALPEYSTFPEDMKAEALEEGSEVPIDRTLVKMKPRPWSRKWERYLLKGVEKLEGIPQLFVQRMENDILNNNEYNYNTMLEYRRHATEEIMYNICKRLAEHEKNIVKVRQDARAKRFLRIAKKSTLGETTTVPEGETQSQEQA